MDFTQYDALLDDAHGKLKHLKALYQQWFQGVERFEPAQQRRGLERVLKTLRREKPRNTAARFKFQQLQARYNTYAIYWTRISRQIEEGTFARDLRRAKRRRRPARDPDETKTKTFELDLDSVDLFAENEISSVLEALGDGPPAKAGPSDELRAEKTSPDATNPFAVKPVTATFGRPKAVEPAPARVPTPTTPKRPVSGARAKPPSPPPVPTSTAKPPVDGNRRIYDRYVAARQRNNEGTDISFDKLTASIETMRTKLRRRHGDKSIDFEVVVRDGRVGLKPKIG